MSPLSVAQPAVVHEIAATASVKEQLKTLQFSAPLKNEMSHLLTKTANASVEARQSNQYEPELVCEDELFHLCQDVKNSIEEYLSLNDLANLMQTSKDNNVMFGNTERGQKLKEANQLARGPFDFPPVSTRALAHVAVGCVLTGCSAGCSGGVVALFGWLLLAPPPLTFWGAIVTSAVGGGFSLATWHRGDAEGRRAVVGYYESVRDYRDDLGNNVSHGRIQELRTELKQLNALRNVVS